MGLTGFDGKSKWYVSTRSWAMGGSLISLQGSGSESEDQAAQIKSEIVSVGLDIVMKF